MSRFTENFKKRAYLFFALVLFQGLFLNSIAVAKKDAMAQAQKNQVLKILKKYNNAAAVSMKTERTENKKTLGTSAVSQGEIIYSKNKIYFLTDKPTKIEIIYNKSVWVVEYPDLELDDKAGRKVTVFQANKVSFIKTMAELFSAPEKFLSKEASISDFGDEMVLDLKKLKTETLREIKVSLSKKEQVIKNIYLVDDLETQTSLFFGNTEFLKTAPKKKFVYEKIKTDEILKP